MSKESSSPQIISKHAVIWARVSTNDQSETSLPSQVSRCKDKLESSGYQITRTFAVDWSSLDLFSCPEFQQLRGLINNKEIDALGVFDRDRLEAKGLQRLTFLAECKDAGVQLILCQGPAILNEPEGQLIELALAIGKEQQVLRARQGSRDGLRDRVQIYRNPVTYRKVYGFNWDKANNKLLPSGDYPNVKLIFDMLLAGSGYTPIIKELKHRGILSPSGLPEWNKQAISKIIHNPVYAGRYYGLKSKAVEPSIRPKKSKRVNSSKRLLPLEDKNWLKNVEVVDPPITWDQRESLLAQTKQHMRLSQRHANNDYLLRGLIVCGTHFGKQGEPRVYHGRPHHGSFAYVCPVGGDCSRPFIKGPDLDELAKFYIKCLLINKPDEFYPLGTKNRQKAEDGLARQIREAELKLTKRTQALANLEYRASLKDVGPLEAVDPEAYQLAKLKLNMEKKGLEQTISELQGKMSQLGREKEAEETLKNLATKYQLYLLSSDLTNAQWREIFVALNFKVKVGLEGVTGQNPGMSDVIFEVGIPLSIAAMAPLNDLAIESIASNYPGHG